MMPYVIGLLLGLAVIEVAERISAIIQRRRNRRYMDDHRKQTAILLANLPPLDRS